MKWYKVTAFHVFYEEERRFMCTKRTIALIEDDPVYIVKKIEQAPAGTARKMQEILKKQRKRWAKIKKHEKRTGEFPKRVFID